MSFPPTFFGNGVQIDSIGNGVSISNSIFRNITGATYTNSAGVRILFSDAGALIADSLFYNIAGCADATTAPNCAALGLEAFSGANAEPINTTIASNSQCHCLHNGPGVWLSPSAGIGNSVIANTISKNGGTSFNNGLAVDLGNIGPDANHEPPVTSGPNDLQNYPVLVGNIATTLGQVVTGTLDAKASQNYRLDFYFSLSAPSGYAGRGEGGTYYGYLLVTTDSAGIAPSLRRCRRRVPISG